MNEAQLSREYVIRKGKLPCWQDGRFCVCTAPLWTCRWEGGHSHRVHSSELPPPLRLQSHSCSPQPRNTIEQPGKEGGSDIGIGKDTVVQNSPLVQQEGDGQQKFSNSKRQHIGPQVIRYNEYYKVNTKMTSINQLYQGFGSGSALNWVAGSVSGSAFKLRIRIQEGKNDPQKLKKVQNFHVFKYWMFSFEGWRLLL